LRVQARSRGASPVGRNVEVHDNRFAQDAPDEEWLPVVSEAGWLVVTKDSAIARNHLQRMMVAKHGARLFVFASAGVRGPEMAAAIAKSARAMKAQADEHEAPFVAKVYKNGKVEIWKDCVALRAEDDI
jgi:hypothetical protein